MTTVNTIMRDEFLAGGRGNFVTARYLRLAGTNREIGRALAKVARREQQIVRYLLDTCATVDEAKEALLYV